MSNSNNDKVRMTGKDGTGRITSTVEQKGIGDDIKTVSYTHLTLPTTPYV